MKLIETAIMKFDKINAILTSAPLTLIHNDCNPRNICLHAFNGGESRMCLYDWELATLDVPQRDVAEFLTFTLLPATSIATRVELINFYRCNLEKYSGVNYAMDRY